MVFEWRPRENRELAWQIPGAGVSKEEQSRLRLWYLACSRNSQEARVAGVQ